MQICAFCALQACAKVTKYVAGVVQQLRSGLDGKNVDVALREFGIRFHRTIFEHLQQYQYSSMGVYNARDVTTWWEFKTVIVSFRRHVGDL